MKPVSRLFASTLCLALAGLALVPTLASARARANELGSTGVARAYGSYTFVCDNVTTTFPGTPVDMAVGGSYFMEINSTNPPHNCPAPASFARMNASYPAAGECWALARVSGDGGADLTTQALTNTVTDSLDVKVNRSVPTQVTFTLRGTALHSNTTTGGGPVSRLRVTVYPTATDANNETNAISTGEVAFFGTATVQTSGILKAGDVSSVIPLPNNSYQITLNAVRTVTVPSAANACVTVQVDPRAVSVVPASTPWILVLLSTVLLIGAIRFLMSRGRLNLA